MFDLLLTNGTIVDGTGARAYVGDVGIKGNKIVALSSKDGGKRLTASAALRTIDCSNRLVCPGWVDIHTHLDGQITWDPMISPLSGGGITTAVQGNCGVGFAPCKKEDRKFLMELMEGVEDIPLGAMDQGIKWEWETFPQYLDSLAKKEFAIDIGAMVGHGPVRAYVMGKRANVSDKPGGPTRDPVTAKEIEEIACLVGESVKAGALGFSTSRTLLHRDRNGTLVPGTLATDAELLAIGKALGEAGGGKAVFEMASDFMTEDDEKHSPENHRQRLSHFGREFRWMKIISKGYNVPLCYCLGLPSASGPMAYGYRAMLRQVDMANADGCKLKVQVFTRPQGVLLAWDARSHPFTECPSFAQVWAQRDVKTGRFDKTRLLRDAALREAIVREAAALAQSSSDSGNFGMTLPQSTDNDGPGNLNAAITTKGALAKMYVDNAKDIFQWTKTYEPAAESSAWHEAQRRGVSSLHVVYDWLCEDEGKAVLSYMFMNYAHKSLDDCYEMLVHPATVPGLGDTGAHLGFLSDPTSPSYLLAHWHRDRTTGPRLPLELAVKLHSRDTAMVFNLADRGAIEVGLLADINVIDLARLDIKKPRFVRDLPLGAARWIQEVSGYDYTIKSGVVTFIDGTPTGERPGRLVRGKYDELPSRYSSVWGKLAMTVSEAKWAGEQAVLEALLATVGPQRLESIGFYINERFPLTGASKL